MGGPYPQRLPEASQEEAQTTRLLPTKGPHLLWPKTEILLLPAMQAGSGTKNAQIRQLSLRVDTTRSDAHDQDHVLHVEL